MKAASDAQRAGARIIMCRILMSRDIMGLRDASCRCKLRVASIYEASSNFHRISRLRVLWRLLRAFSIRNARTLCIPREARVPERAFLSSALENRLRGVEIWFPTFCTSASRIATCDFRELSHDVRARRADFRSLSLSLCIVYNCEKYYFITRDVITPL